MAFERTLFFRCCYSLAPYSLDFVLMAFILFSRWSAHTIQYQIRLFMLIYWRVLAQIYRFRLKGVSNSWCPWNGSFFSVPPLCSARIINVKRKHWLYDIGRWCRHRERRPCKQANTKHWNLCVLLIIQHTIITPQNRTLFNSSIWMRRRRRRRRKKHTKRKWQNENLMLMAFEPPKVFEWAPVHL